MAKAINRDRQLLKADISFALLGIVSIAGTFGEFAGSAEAIPEVAQPLLMTGIVVGLILILGAIISKVASIDRDHSEEYTFQLLSQGAVVGVMVTFVMNVLWFDIFLGRWLGELSADHLLTILMGGWAFGYYFHRIRGVA
ncbi:hypothetical protein [Pontixanthobacter sp. CEM42]|uniref:hypothetical protein n=1 Tax=Pontixanthobacter sp. CEM42 TaxID=2792077 RepID=UPI001ADFA89E|nr:hypothetical protein [Pontixanthobacter sp. CEM42]